MVMSTEASQVGVALFPSFLLILIDKGFHEAETSSLSYTILSKCIYNLPRDLFTVYT